MIRPWMLALVVACGLTAALPLTASAQDYYRRYPVPGNGGIVPPPIGSPRYHDHHYHVRYRPDCHSRWQTYATYDSHRQAHRIANWLEARGYETDIVHH
jgi:hypothetical protein